MYHLHKLALAFLAAAALAGPVQADENRLVFGQDVYAGGSNPTLSEPSPRDALVTGFSITIGGKVEGDAHAIGFDIDVTGPVGRDLYAAGFSVDVKASIGEDLTATGANVTVEKAATVAGNVRIAGGTLTIDAPVTGSLLAAGGDITLNGPVGGDAMLTAGTLSFGPDAKIAGKLTYSAPEPITIPASVISADRVQYSKIETSSVDGVRKTMDDSVGHVVPSSVTLVTSFIISLIFMVVIAGIVLMMAPARVEALRASTEKSPIRSFVFGLLGLSMLVGLVPISAITLIGIPLIPFLLLAIIIIWLFGYMLGVYALAWKLAGALMTPPETVGGRLTVLAVGLAVFAALNYIPFVGWLINLVAVMAGMGALTRALIERLIGTRLKAMAAEPTRDSIEI